MLSNYHRVAGGTRVVGAKILSLEMEAETLHHSDGIVLCGPNAVTLQHGAGEKVFATVRQRHATARSRSLAPSNRNAAVVVRHGCTHAFVTPQFCKRAVTWPRGKVFVACLSERNVFQLRLHGATPNACPCFHRALHTKTFPGSSNSIAIVAP